MLFYVLVDYIFIFFWRIFVSEAKIVIKIHSSLICCKIFDFMYIWLPPHPKLTSNFNNPPRHLVNAFFVHNFYHSWVWKRRPLACEIPSKILLENKANKLKCVGPFLCKSNKQSRTVHWSCGGAKPFLVPMATHLQLKIYS